jgi:hypothetical protein
MRGRTPLVERRTRLAPEDPDVTRLSGRAEPARYAPTRPPSSGHSPRSKTLSSSSGWSGSTSDIDHGRFDPGALLDQRYRIVGRLGKGDMGEVYRADDLRLGQPVALKFLPADVDRDPARLTQLHTEVRMARQVSHPNVCRVYDIGEYDGHTFLSMEYVDGEDLGSLLRRIGRFPQDRAIELARQICAGLAAAHDRSVVHRDLKPANIMLDGAGRIRITDFGLAGATGETLRAGTPAYMAPEQLAGAEVTPRSDIYSLGLVLYELFTGRRPRRREHRRAHRQARAGGNYAADGHRARYRSVDRADPPSLPRSEGREPSRVCAGGLRRASGWRSTRGGPRRRTNALARDGRSRGDQGRCFSDGGNRGSCVGRHRFGGDSAALPTRPDGMFSPGSPAIDLLIGVIITARFVMVIGWAGLLTAIAALATHFVLLHGPLTTDFSSWRGPTGMIFLGTILVMGLGGCYLTARSGARTMVRGS